MVLRKSGPATERLLPHRGAEPLGKPHDRRPAILRIGARADDERGRVGRIDQLDERTHVRVGHRIRADDLDRGPRGQRVRRFGPVAHRRDDERRRAGAIGLVIGAGDRAGQVLRAQRRRGPHRVLAGEPIERAPGEERLERQLPAVLLSDDDHQGRPGVTGVGDRVDRVAEARRGVQVDERGHDRERARTRLPSPRRSLRGARGRTRMSPGRSVRNGISVEPGLPKIVVIPNRRMTSNVASRTVTRTTYPTHRRAAAAIAYDRRKLVG